MKLLSVLILSLALDVTSVVAQTTRGSNQCSFNQGICPMNTPSGRGSDHGYVQDYGYGGLTAAAAAGAIRALNPGLIIAEITSGEMLNTECVWSLGAAAQTAGGVAWNGNCSDATRAETELLQCTGQAGLGYSFRGNFNDLLRVNDNLDPVQEELVYQTAIGDIRDFTLCQQSLFQSYSSNETVRTELVNNAYQQFLDVQAPLRSMTQQRAALLQRLVGRRSGMESSTCMSSLDCTLANAGIDDDPEVRALSARIKELDEHINLLVARIPMGNRDNMAAMLRELVRSPANISRAQFGQRFHDEMVKLNADVTASLATIQDITVTHPDGQYNFCVDRELKKNLVRSGQLQTTVERMGLKDSLAGFTCRAENRYGVAGEVITELALIPTYFVGYGAARLAVRAGASTIRAVSAAGRTLATASRGAMLGLEAADWTMAGAAAIRDCNSDEFFARVQSQRGCDPMGEVAQMYEEASLAQCLSSALIPAGSALVGSTVRVVSSRRLAAATPNTTPSLNPDEVIDDAATISATAPRLDFFFSREASAGMEQALRARGIAPGRRLSDAQLAGLSPEERLSLFERMGDLALTRNEGLRFLDILRDSGGRIDGRAERRLRELLADQNKTPGEIDTILARARTNRLFEAAPANATPSLTVADTTPHNAGGSASPLPAGAGSGARLDTPPPGTGGSLRATRTSDELTTTIDDELRLAVADTAPRPDLATFAAETRAAIRQRFETWTPEMRAQVDELLGQVQGQERRRYLVMLLNTQPSTDPSRALDRIRRFRNGDEAARTQVMQELDREIATLAEQMRGRDLFDLQGVNLSAQRSSLMTQRALFDLGDEVSIERIFSTDAYNDVARSAGREPHSLSGAFNVDLKVTGNNVSVCRGSLATATALSPLAGGFTTICRRGGYLDNSTVSDVLAAPRSVADGDLGGYSRFNRFDLAPDTEVSMGRNGPVAYSFNGSEGSGGNGGGVEFFFSRSQTPIAVDNLSVSVRVPTCQGPPGSRCAEILDIQSSVRLDDLRGSAGTERLAAAGTRTDAMVRALADDVDLMNSGETASQALRRLETQNPELMSALNLRRELDLKTAPGAGRRDADTELLLSRVREAGSFGPQTAAAVRGAATDAATAQRRITDAIEENPLTRAYQDMQREAESLLTRANRASDPAERDRLLREMARVRGQQSDVRLAYHTYIYNFERALRAELGLGSRAALPQEFLDAINAGAAGIVTRSN